MNDITIFNHLGNNIRTVTTEDGTPLFCGKDVAITLGYKDTTNALKLHCRGAVKHHPIVDSLGRSQSARVTTDEQGEPLFVLKDICDALEIKNPSMVAGRLDAEDLSQTEVLDNRGVQQKTSSSLSASTLTVRSGHSSSSPPLASPTSQESSASRHKKRRHQSRCRLFFTARQTAPHDAQSPAATTDQE